MYLRPDECQSISIEFRRVFPALSGMKKLVKNRMVTSYSMNLDLSGKGKHIMGGSPGLVVMGGDSCSKGRGFESRRRILDGHDIFSH